jgi:hypothetical protein
MLPGLGYFLLSTLLRLLVSDILSFEAAHQTIPVNFISNECFEGCTPLHAKENQRQKNNRMLCRISNNNDNRT